MLAVGFILGFSLGSYMNISIATVTVSGTLEKTVKVIRPTTMVSLIKVTITEIVILNSTKPLYGNSSCIIFKTDRDVYNLSEVVVIVLMNDCDYVLRLPNSASWLVMDADGRVVYSPIALQVIIDVKPGGKRG